MKWKDKSAKTKLIIGALVLVILTASVYVYLQDSVKISVENTKTKFYVWEDSWVLSATEYVNLFDGTKKMRASSREVVSKTIGDITYIIRTSFWKDNIITIDTYAFDTTKKEVEFFPIKHTVQCFDCVGKIVHFEYRDILYEGETNIITSPFNFGHNMKLEWQSGAYRAKVYQQKVASDKIIIRYKPTSDYEVYNVRLSDPKKIEYEYLYANLSKKVKIKEDVLVEIPKKYNSINNTWSETYNYTDQIVTGYKTEHYQKTGDKILDRIGVKVLSKEYYDWYDVCDNWLVHYLVNPGDRNREEYCRCRSHELSKVTCEEIDLLK